MNQGRTKERPKNSETQKSTFIKIAVSFTSLIPTLIPPRELRETTEGTPKEDHMTKKALFLRLSPKKVVLIPEKVISLPKKVDSFPEKVDYIPEIVAYPPNKKSPSKAIFLAQFKKKYYLCTVNLRRGVSDITGGG